MTHARGEFLRFCLVGCIGFIVDAGLTLGVTWALGASAFVARLVAFGVAATVTWGLHARFTFGKPQQTSSWLHYVLLTSTGALINLIVYLVWLHFAGATPAQILLGVAAGSGVALGFNFFASRRWIFR